VAAETAALSEPVHGIPTGVVATVFGPEQVRSGISTLQIVGEACQISSAPRSICESLSGCGTGWSILGTGPAQMREVGATGGIRHDRRWFDVDVDGHLVGPTGLCVTVKPMVWTVGRRRRAP
jgi:hypothetical protein